MAGSQLKRLKASLREQGITGPQKSKKQRRKLAQGGDGARNEKRLQRGVVLDGIREQFNPFDLKHAARGPKFDVTTLRSATDRSASIKGRPGLAKAAGEEKRRETLLVDLQRRNKVGGILDRRFGENDPTMTPEEKMLERFAREKQRSHKKSAMFDLEGDDEPMMGLTHGGKSLAEDDDDDGPVDDFNEGDLGADDDDEDGGDTREKRLKRLRAIIAENGEEGTEEGQPERKKSKKEVMEEVIAKSKLHKYERQAAKEDDEELRHQLNKELPNIQMLLSTGRNGAQRENDAAAAATTIAGIDRDAFDKNFDLEVKKLGQDKRAKPSDRTKTEDEKAEEDSNRLKRLEEKRQKRMMGEEVSDSDEEESEEEEEEEKKKQKKKKDNDNDNDEYGDMQNAEDHDNDEFGLGRGIKTRPTATELGFDDEDDFLIEDDLVASGSDLELVESDDGDEDDEDDDDDLEGGSDEQDGQEIEQEEEDDEFTKGLLNEEEARNPIFRADPSTLSSNAEGSDEHGLPFTFSCPQTVVELVTTVKPYAHTDIPKIVQRIRALYHPKLDSKNKEKLASFSVSLVDFVVLPWESKTAVPFATLESVIRHIHSLSKQFPLEIAKRFRDHIEEISESRPTALLPSDLILFTAIGSIYPTSDHFHQVITPAMLSMARYLGQKAPQDLSEYATGAYLSILSLQYQQLSKRYVPEVINFSLNTICALAPVASATKMGNFPLHEPAANTRCKNATATETRRLKMSDCLPLPSKPSGAEAASLKVSLLDTSIQILDAAAETLTGKSSFAETFTQAVTVLKHLATKSCRAHLPPALSSRASRAEEKLERMIRVSQLSRRNLELHHHRPLAIKTFVPRFEETFDPDKHYDPDRERAELAKLKAEHKKERKGAMRELRKDANFMAREKLRIKKAKDEAYEKKYKRLVAEIQNEEGRESNAYQKEAKARKRANARR